MHLNVRLSETFSVRISEVKSGEKGKPAISVLFALLLPMILGGLTVGVLWWYVEKNMF